MTKLIYSALILAAVATCLSSAAPHPPNQDYVRDDLKRVLYGNLDDKLDDPDMDNNLFAYNPLKTKRVDYAVSEGKPTKQMFADLEREATSNIHQVDSSNPTPKVAPSLAVDSAQERIKSIAFNSREVRLVGPDQKEVEMKDDMATKMIIALENLQKEATEVWGQVNEKLDKGWTDLKTMVEGAIQPPKKSTTIGARQLREAPSPSKSSVVMVSDLDGYSMADDNSSKQAETAGTKIKGFLSNIGLNEENQKKASDALSKAGTSVSDTMTKDLPDALKKAGNAVSETVTSDIPNAFKNFFG